ncbi:MAG: imidazole glycerol phosphate synthase subunit HisH [Planctomycetaceae bacterium]
MIGIIDYRMGNLRSVQKAFESLGVEARICARPAELQGLSKWILPGVGAFRDAIAALRSHDFVGAINAHVAADRPLLGICLGLQLLFDCSYEDGVYDGLGIVPGEVVRFQSHPGLKIPHMGWNTLDIERPNPVLDGIPAGSHAYFVHSYHVVPTDPEVVATRTTHGDPFVSMIRRGNLFATQFHPEKSQAVGLRLLRNFAEL